MFVIFLLLKWLPKKQIKPWGFFNHRKDRKKSLYEQIVIYSDWKGNLFFLDTLTFAQVVKISIN